VIITTEETGTKGDKYYKRDRKIEAYKVKVRITTGVTGTEGKNYYGGDRN